MSEKISMMAAFAERLYARMAEDPRIRVMTADLVGSCALKKIEADHRDQFINVGIAEQNMVSIAAGLAHEGMIPFTYTFAAFHAMRSCEQVRTDVFYNEQNVKVIGTHCGVSTGQAGSTHFALEDIAILRGMPKSVVLVPSDPVSAAETADVAYQRPHGVYVRLDRNPAPALYQAGERFSIGKAHVLKDGADIVLFAAGTAVHAALEAAAMIESRENLSVAVVDLYSIKPLDVACVTRYAGKCRHAFTIEEHNVCGGVFGAVAECIVRTSRGCTLHPIAIEETYPHGNTVERARELLGLDADGITETVCRAIKE